jgi:hypothetical protein
LAISLVWSFPSALNLQVGDLVLELQLLGLQLRGELVLVVEQGRLHIGLAEHIELLLQIRRALVKRTLSVIQLAGDGGVALHPGDVSLILVGMRASSRRRPASLRRPSRSSVSDYQPRLRFSLFPQGGEDLIRLATRVGAGDFGIGSTGNCCCAIAIWRRTLSTSSCSLLAPSWATRAK